MSDTIPKSKQQELCDVLNGYALPNLTWYPDPSAIPGGIEARRADDGAIMWEVRRDAGRVHVLLPFRRRTRVHDRGAFIGDRNAFDGAGWVPRFASALASYIMAQPVEPA